MDLGYSGTYKFLRFQATRLVGVVDPGKCDYILQSLPNQIQVLKLISLLLLYSQIGAYRKQSGEGIARSYCSFDSVQFENRNLLQLQLYLVSIIMMAYTLLLLVWVALF